MPRNTYFKLEPGRKLAGKYIVGDYIGGGWEGEVYHIKESATGIERAAKFFFPERNPGNRAVKSYARKLDKLRRCDAIIHYHTQETFSFQGESVTFMISELVHGDVLSEFIKRQRGKRLHPFEATHLLHSLTRGIEQIHRAKEYHGDIHTDNILVNKFGIGFEVRFVDFYNWGRVTAAHHHEDIVGLIQVFHEALGGPRHYAKLPPEIKYICSGLKQTLIKKKFRSARKLREHLETMEWS